MSGRRRSGRRSPLCGISPAAKPAQLGGCCPPPGDCASLHRPAARPQSAPLEGRKRAPRKRRFQDWQPTSPGGPPTSWWSPCTARTWSRYQGMANSVRMMGPAASRSSRVSNRGATRSGGDSSRFSSPWTCGAGGACRSSTWAAGRQLRRMQCEEGWPGLAQSRAQSRRRRDGGGNTGGGSQSRREQMTIGGGGVADARLLSPSACLLAVPPACCPPAGAPRAAAAPRPARPRRGWPC